MPSFKSSGPHLPTHKLTHLERLYLYDYKAMEYIVKQTGRPRVVRGDGTDKYDLVLKWIEQDQLIVNGCASDYASTPGEDGLKPQSKEWNRFHARRDNAMKDLRKAIQAGWTLAQAWAAQPKPVKRRKKDTSARNVSNTVDNESSEEESETATSKDIQAMKNLTKSQLISELKRWNVSHPGVRNLGPLQELWEEQYRARQQKQFDEGRNAQRNHTNKGADEKVASDPVPKKTTVSGTKKRKRKANDNEQVDHKRAKVGMADWLEKNVDAQMTKTDDDIDVGTPHPQKRTIAMRKLPNRADISTRNAANKSALKSTLSRGPKSKQANSMDPSGSDENLPRRGEHLEIGDSGVDIPGNKECNVQGVESPATRRSTRSRSTTTVPMTTQRATHPTAAHKRRSAQIVIDEEYEAVNSDEKVALTTSSGRASRRLASESTSSTYATRSRSAPAQNVTDSVQADPEHQEEKKKFWSVRNHTDNYNDIPLSETLRTRPNSLDYPQLMSWRKNMLILARRKALAENKPWPPPVPKKKEKYDYRKDPDWWKVE